MKLFLVLGVALFCSACSRPLFISEDEPATTFIITSTKDTNCGTPLYVLLKFTDFPEFVMDDYATIAEFSVMSHPDSTSFMTLCLMPGRTEQILAKTPPGKSTGVYCLFTQCGDRWKQLIDPFEGCQEVTIVLGQQEIESVSMR